MMALVLPSFQHLTGIFAVRDLDGDFVLSNKPKLIDTAWMDGSFQKKYNGDTKIHCVCQQRIAFETQSSVSKFKFRTAIYSFTFKAGIYSQ